MKLSAALQSDFPSYVRTRGADYYLSGAVQIKQGSDTEVNARVQGARNYEVDLSWDGEELCLWCDCPFFASSGPCRHLWAAILAAEASGHLKAADIGPRTPVFYDYGESEELDEFELPPPRPLPPPPAAKPRVEQPDWRDRLKKIAPAVPMVVEQWPPGRQILYVVDVAGSIANASLVVNLWAREPKRDGEWKKPAPPRLTRRVIPRLPDPADRQILGLLSGAASHQSWMPYGNYEELPQGFRVLHPLSDTVMPLIAATGRCVIELNPSGGEHEPLAWDPGAPWRFRLRMQRESDNRWVVTGCLHRGEEEMDLAIPALVTAGGLVFTRNRIARLEEDTPFEWMSYLRKAGRIEATESDGSELLAALLEQPIAAHLEVPEELRYEEVRLVPRPRLTVRAPKSNPWERERLRATLSFDYDGRLAPESLKSLGVYDAAERKYIVRDRAAEESARETLRKLGFSGPTQGYQQPEPEWGLAPKKLPGVVHACIQAGWHVEAEGKTFRRPGAMHISVSSGIDWFELHGEVSYGNGSAKLPALLAALRRGENMVALDDGTYGILPEEWLTRFGSLAGLGSPETDHLRFRRNQAGLLDALLAAQPEIRCDETFARLRDQLRSFAGIQACDQPAGFVGQLREYQREGAGWMEFLRRFGFGGCLADDMGVGKTAQVLAVLEHRRALRAAQAGGEDAPSGPSLVVVPKSLVFNWKQEAARFTPRLRVLDHTGAGRGVDGFADCDVVLTTYGTLRRDAAEFRDITFDYVVLDEAQAIKNASTESAKAARLLRGRHRIALSGTPVENHLGELWSLFEFLNPGMLGAASVFKLTGPGAKNPSEETRGLLAHALRPFILRRTKDQVARELPAKTEQTIFCELEGAQRKLYDELRAYYRDSLLKAVDAQGLAKSKIQVLEALLRLRQTACHPGLVDARRRHEPCAKIELLMGHLGEVVEEGHKALVFSQFTSLLSIVRERLDKEKIVYEYLDGATNHRQQHVERFQNDPHCPVFLISLKAGGLGLNLTAAEYVFLLDPWWNPAVEAQAVDRTHRIGQTRQVFAYRLIARDTVEEKVLELQDTKRDLAAAILGQDKSLVRNLRREDLELLLS
ncbi:MAG: DEAD/DEAH box helicase [Acidobacteria bacterium]|nr:DEAD/DEAH box helicase [Acidobacteriota bacterium]